MNNRIDMSLDDIIRSKRTIKTNSFQSRKEPTQNKPTNNRNFGANKNFGASNRNFGANKNFGANRNFGTNNKNFATNNKNFATNNRNFGPNKKNFDLSQKLINRKSSGDARLTIVVKQRAKIHDARDKLNQLAKKTDARFKIRDKIAKKTQSVKTFDPRTMQQIKQQLMNNSPNNKSRMMLMGSRGLTRTISGNFRLRNPRSRLGDGNKRIIMNNDGILVTTRNEIKLRTTRIGERMDLDENPLQNASSQTFQRNRLSANLQSRLDGNDQVGCKVIVSNLHPSVTQDDIEELFGEIGVLRRASLGKTGTAEILFLRAADAQKACEVYHNRQLDGIPMNLKISSDFGGFRSDSMPSRIAPDADVIRQALFSESRVATVSSYPRFNVRMSRN